jgi:cytoskeletal protein CcmA (bactofilin family)
MLFRAATIYRNLALWARVPNPTAVKGRIEVFMLDQRVDAASSSVPDPIRQVRPGTASKSSVSAVGAQSTIGKTLIIKGEITGSESVLIEGKVEGSIALPDDRVTVGRSGRVSANIAAQDIVVLGEVVGNCTAGDHLDIRNEGSLCGDVVVSRISVEEGAYLTGSIDIRKKPALAHKEEEHELVESLHVN